MSKLEKIVATAEELVAAQFDRCAIRQAFTGVRRDRLTAHFRRLRCGRWRIRQDLKRA